MGELSLPGRSCHPNSHRCRINREGVLAEAGRTVPISASSVDSKARLRREVGAQRHDERAMACRRGSRLDRFAYFRLRLGKLPLL